MHVTVTLLLSCMTSAYVHPGEPCRKHDIELLCICTDSYMCLRRTTSHCCYLQESHSAQWCRCTHRLTMIRVQLHHRRQQQSEANQCKHKWCCAYTISVGQPLVVAASRTMVSLPWLISSSSLHQSCMHIAVDCIPEHYRQNQDSTPHCTIICLTSHSAIITPVQSCNILYVVCQAIQAANAKSTYVKQPLIWL